MKVLICSSLLVLASAICFSQSAKELTQKGMEFYEKREYTEAILNLNKALEVDPNYYQAYYMRGNIKAVFEDFHGAMKDYNVAVEKNLKFADGYFGRGVVKMGLKDYYGAIADFTTVIALNENYVEAYFNRGRAKQFLLAYEDAINDCSKIIQINPKNSDAYHMRGLLRINFGNTQEGCLDLSKAGELGDLRAYEDIKDKCNLKSSSSD